MNKLSTGSDSTLGEYLKLASVVFGHESTAAKFLKDKILSSPNGEDEEVLADESQMIIALSRM